MTSLFDTTRVPKSSKRVEVYGTVDELDSSIGVVIAHLNSKKHSLVKVELQKIQNDLLNIGSTLANPKALPIPGLNKRPADFEKLIDQMTENMPKLQNFILPGGSKAGAFIHLSRTIGRRVERRMVALIQEKDDIDGDILIYVNRLSDLLFTMSRYVNHIDHKKEIIWKKK